MAEAFANRLAAERGVDLVGESAGTLGAGTINPVAAAAMAEVGVPLDGHYPKVLTQEMVQRADRVISMGCGVDAEACPTRFIVTEDWNLDDPAGQPLEKVREVRDAIRTKVSELVDSLSSG